MIRWKDHSYGTSLDPSEPSEHAVRLVIEVRGDHASESAAIRLAANKLGITSSEQVRKWVRQAEGQIQPAETPGRFSPCSDLQRCLQPRPLLATASAHLCERSAGINGE